MRPRMRLDVPEFRYDVPEFGYDVPGFRLLLLLFESGSPRGARPGSAPRLYHDRGGGREVADGQAGS